MFNRQKKKEKLFLELCEILKAKLPDIENSMEYVQAREYGLALEFIIDWCIGAEPEIKLTSSELLKVKEVSNEIKERDLWIELLPVLSNSEMNIFPYDQLTNVNKYIQKQTIDTPLRME